VRIEGRWLLSHADLNRNRVQGYGVPYSAAVVAGGSPAPANTERTDIGAVALQGLLDWSAADRRAPHGAIRRRVLGVLRPYLTGTALSPSGMIAASSRPVDRLVEAPAPAAAMAAVMQRAGRTVGSRTTRGAIRFIGRQTARVLVFLHRTDGSGAWYWPAADGTAEPESLLASAVTGSGLVSYLRHGGRITPRVAPDMLTGRLAEFARRRDLGWLEVARDAPSPERSDRSAGLAALGAALQVAGDTRETTFYRPLIMRAIRAEESKAKGRRPAPLDGLLLLGLSDALSAEK
jgi:hypothetical protein